MLLLSFLAGGFIFTAAYAKWGNHRVKYWKKQTIKMINANDALNAANKELLKDLEEYHALKRSSEMDIMREGALMAAKDLAFGEN